MAQRTTTDVHGLSRIFHVIDALAARATASAVVFVAVVISVGAIALTGFSSELQFVFTTFAAAITLVMVFVIQHTQSRQQLALQIKLDELLRALPQADDRLVHIEVGSDDELQELETRNTAHHASLRDDPEPDTDPGANTGRG
jgi:low affinity Fe/Cu permease